MDLKPQLLLNTEFFFSISLDTLALIESERLVDTLFRRRRFYLNVLVDTLPEVPTEKISNFKQTNQKSNNLFNFVLGRFKDYLLTKDKGWTRLAYSCKLN